MFLCNSISPIPALADSAASLQLPKPGVMVHLSPEFNPPILKGIKVHADNPFRFDFVMDQGDMTPAVAKQAKADYLKEEANRLIKYFLASVTIPEKDLWVNLSPYEKDRIISSSFGVTEMGRDLLAEDYLLKQITASLIYPEDEVGKKFWKRVYEEASKKYKTINIPVNTFNKVWIVPEKAVVYENAKAQTAYVVESKLKVMLEQDYLALEKNSVSLHGSSEANPSYKVTTLPSASRNDTAQLGSQIIREIVIPELTKEVNEGKNFAKLRQVYNSLILATWYKKKIKDSVLSQVYMDKSKTKGINIDNPQEKENIYQQYLQAFKKGVYSYIKEESDPDTQERVQRKYFSGGVHLNLTQVPDGKTTFNMNTFEVKDTPNDVSDWLKNSAMVVKVVALPANQAMPPVVGKGAVKLQARMEDKAMSTQPMMVAGKQLRLETFSNVLAYLKRKTLSNQEIWELSDLDNFEDRLDELKELVNLDFEIALNYTDEGRWVLYTGEETGVDHKIILPLFQQGRILIDIHTHPMKQDSLGMAGHPEYPSMFDLDIYSKWGNTSLIISSHGITQVTRPLNNYDGGDLRNLEYSFVDRFDSWIYKMRKDNSFDKRHLYQVTDEEERGFLNAVGVKLEVLPWSNHHQMIGRIKEIINQGKKADPLQKFHSKNLSEEIQANTFIRERLAAHVSLNRLDHLFRNMRDAYIKAREVLGISESQAVDVLTFLGYLNYPIGPDGIRQVVETFNTIKDSDSQFNIDFSNDFSKERGNSRFAPAFIKMSERIRLGVPIYNRDSNLWAKTYFAYTGVLVEEEFKDSFIILPNPDPSSGIAYLAYLAGRLSANPKHPYRLIYDEGVLKGSLAFADTDSRRHLYFGFNVLEGSLGRNQALVFSTILHEMIHAWFEEVLNREMNSFLSNARFRLIGETVHGAKAYDDYFISNEIVTQLFNFRQGVRELNNILVSDKHSNEDINFLLRRSISSDLISPFTSSGMSLLRARRMAFVQKQLSGKLIDILQENSTAKDLNFRKGSLTNTSEGFIYTDSKEEDDFNPKHNFKVLISRKQKNIDGKSFEYVEIGAQLPSSAGLPSGQFSFLVDDQDLLNLVIKALDGESGALSAEQLWEVCMKNSKVKEMLEQMHVFSTNVFKLTLPLVSMMQESWKLIENYRVASPERRVENEKRIFDFWQSNIDRIYELLVHIEPKVVAEIQAVIPPEALKDKGTREFLDAMNPDKAATVIQREKGGIDLTHTESFLQTKNDDGKISFTIDPVMLAQLQNAPGFEPKIIDIQELNDVKVFLGVQ